MAKGSWSTQRKPRKKTDKERARKFNAESHPPDLWIQICAYVIAHVGISVQ